MRFIINGLGYEINRDAIERATRGVLPDHFDGRHKYYVEVHKTKYPIKQVLHLATGLDNSDFTAQYAHRILRRLGFVVHSLQVMSSPEPKRRTTAKSTAVEGAMKLAISLEQDEDGLIVASCPALPGCHSQGRTEEEAIANIKEAIRGYIASMRRHGEPIPAIKEVREIEVLV